MTDKKCSAGAKAPAEQKQKDGDEALEIDCERRTGKLTTGKVKPGQLLEVNRKPLQQGSGVGGRESEAENGEEIIQ
jgi:hypothetical protein